MWPEETATEKIKRGLAGNGMAGVPPLEERLKQPGASEPGVNPEMRRAAMGRCLKLAGIAR